MQALDRLDIGSAEDDHIGLHLAACEREAER